MSGKSSAKKWYSWYFGFNLLYRILIGLVLGLILGLVFKESILWIQPLGDLFVRLLKMIMMPIIVSTLIVGASSVSPANLGKVGLRVIIFYLITSAVAIVIGLAMGAVFRPSAELANVADVRPEKLPRRAFRQRCLTSFPQASCRPWSTRRFWQLYSSPWSSVSPSPSSASPATSASSTLHQFCTTSSTESPK